MVQEKQLKELFKYIEANWDVCVENVDKTDIKRIFGGVLCEDIMNNTLHEVKDEQPATNPIEQAYERGKKIRQKNWLKDAWIQKLSETESTSDTLTTFSNNWDFATHPEKWELYTEPTEQPSSQAKLDNSFDRDGFEAMFHPEFWELHAEPEQTAKPFDKDRFEAMFRVCAIIGNKEGKVPTWKAIFTATEEALTKLDAYYAEKEKGGANE